MMKRIFFAALFTIVSVPAANALSVAQTERCQVLGQAFAIKKDNVRKATQERDRLATEAETKGEAWENAEAMRNFGAEQAASADAAKAAYEEARKKFNFAEMSLQSQARLLSQDAAVFNAACARSDG